MKYTTEQLKRFVKEIQESDPELSGWQQGFLESVAEKVSKGWRLSDKQAEILGRLYTEKVPQ